MLQETDKKVTLYELVADSGDGIFRPLEGHSFTIFIAEISKRAFRSAEALLY